MSAAEPTPPDFGKMISGFLPLIIIWGFNKLDLDKEDPVVIWSIRGLFAASQLIYFGLVFWLEKQILAQKEKNDKTLVYVAKNPEKQAMSDDSVPAYIYKIEQEWEFDLEQVKGMKSYMGIVITLGLHFYFGFLPALVIQAVTGPLKFFENKVAKAYLFGASIERPFVPEPSPFASLLGQKTEQELMDEWDAEQTRKGRRPANKKELLALTEKANANKKKVKADPVSSEESEQEEKPTIKSKKAKKVD